MKTGVALIHNQRNIFKTMKENHKTTQAVWRHSLQYRLSIIHSGEKTKERIWRTGTSFVSQITSLGDLVLRLGDSEEIPQELS